MPSPARRSILLSLALLLFSAFSFFGHPARVMAAVDAESARSMAAEAFQRASSTARSSMGILSPVTAMALAATPAPTPFAGTSTYRVAIQVGHWKNNELPEQLSSLEGNTGASGGGRREVDINLDVANRVAKVLQDA